MNHRAQGFPTRYPAPLPIRKPTVAAAAPLSPSRSFEPKRNTRRSAQRPLTGSPNAEFTTAWFTPHARTSRPIASYSRLAPGSPVTHPLVPAPHVRTPHAQPIPAAECTIVIELRDHAEHLNSRNLSFSIPDVNPPVNFSSPGRKIQSHLNSTVTARI